MPRQDLKTICDVDRGGRGEDAVQGGVATMLFSEHFVQVGLEQTFAAHVLDSMAEGFPYKMVLL